MNLIPTTERRRTLAAIIAVLAVGVTFLAVQDRRHGWPFSRHHAVTALGDQGQAEPVPGVARAPVDVPRGQLDGLGIRFEPVQSQTLTDSARAVATVVADESRVIHVHPRIAGWLEQLHVGTTGETVRAGQTLAGLYSQELFATQVEYLAALRRAESGPRSSMDAAARDRLRVFGMSDAEIEAITASGRPQRLVAIVAPRAGVVLTRSVNAGTAVDPSTELFTLADLSRVWVIAEVAESDAAHIRTGTVASLSFPSAGHLQVSAPVEFVYPTLTERTRSVRVRMSVGNGTGRLRPGMYGSAEFPFVTREALTVPRDAVVDTGDSQHVFVHVGGDRIEPRTVKVAARSAARVEVLEGLVEGEHVVTTGVFLIDSESRLRASGSTGHVGHGDPPDGAPPPDEPSAPAHRH